MRRSTADHQKGSATLTADASSLKEVTWQAIHAVPEPAFAAALFATMALVLAAGSRPKGNRVLF